MQYHPHGDQAIYDAMYERQKRWGEDVDAYSGDWRDIQQQRFTDKLALYADEDAREAAIRKASQYATGASTTGIFEEDGVPITFCLFPGSGDFGRLGRLVLGF